MKFRKTTFIYLTLLIFLIGQWGCAMTPPKFPAEMGERLGKVGVVTVQYTPSVEFEMPAKGWLGGAARGAVGGTKALIVLAPSAAVIGGASAVVAFAGGGVGVLGALLAIGVLVKGAGYMIIGPFYGAATAEAPATVEEAETSLKGALVSMRIQETMRDHVVQTARAKSNKEIVVIEGQGPESPSDLLTYLPFPDPSIKSVLELRVTRVWLRSTESLTKPLTRLFGKEGESAIAPSEELQINPPLSLILEVRARLIRTADKVLLYDHTWTRESEAHYFSDWAANEGELFSNEIELAYKALSAWVVDSTLVE